MDVLVVLEPDPDTDPEDVERLGAQLRNELRALDVAVTALPADRAPSEWLVTLGAHGDQFGPVIDTITAWLGRRSGAHRVAVTIEGDTLELSSTTEVERIRLVETFVRRHQPV